VAFTTFEIRFSSTDEAAVGRRRLQRAGFTIEVDDDTSALVRAGITDEEDEADAKLDAAIEGVSFDPVIYWQTARLDSFTNPST
jgi:hypothetical protein